MYKDRLLSKNKEWAKNNPEVFVASAYRRRIGGYNKDNSEIVNNIKLVKCLYKFGNKYLDAYSMTLIDTPTIDHIIPIGYGGDSNYNNFCVTTKNNNSSKHKKTLFSWLCERGGLG